MGSLALGFFFSMHCQPLDNVLSLKQKTLLINGQSNVRLGQCILGRGNVIARTKLISALSYKLISFTELGSFGTRYFRFWLFILRLLSSKKRGSYKEVVMPACLWSVWSAWLKNKNVEKSQWIQNFMSSLSATMSFWIKFAVFGYFLRNQRFFFF